MSKLGLVWGLVKVLAPEALVRLIYTGHRTTIAGRVINPKAQAAGDLVMAIRGVNAMPSLEESRRQLDTLATKFDQPCPQDVITQDVDLPGLTGSRTGRIYVPAGADPMAAQPTLLFLHGGGWVQGSLQSHHSLCGKLAKQGGLRVISYDYVLAPEHEFPALPDDVLMVYRALINGAADLGVTPQDLIVGGDSAGANLTAALMHDLQTAGDPLPRGQMLIYPAVDGTMTSQSMQDLTDQPLLPRARIDWFMDHYLPAGQDRTDPRFSPLFSDRLSGQPPALIIAAGHDPRWDEGLSYAQNLQTAGVPVQLTRFEGQVHGFLSLTKVIPEGRKAIDIAAKWLRERQLA